MDPMGCEAAARARMGERAAAIRQAERFAPMFADASSGVATPADRISRLRRLVGAWLVRAGRWIGGPDAGRAVLAPAAGHEGAR